MLRNSSKRPLTKGPLVKGEIDIKDRKGIENLLGTLKADLKGSEPRRLGILVDADQNLDTRWQSFVTILKEFYGIVPTHPSPEGTIIKEEGRLPVGIWLMPDNRLPGMLEHFCSFMVPSDDVLWPIADNVLLEVVSKTAVYATIQQFLAQHPRCVLGSEEIVDYQGQEAIRISLIDILSAAQLTLFLHSQTLQPLATILE